MMMLNGWVAPHCNDVFRPESADAILAHWTSDGLRSLCGRIRGEDWDSPAQRQLKRRLRAECFAAQFRMDPPWAVRDPLTGERYFTNRNGLDVASLTGVVLIDVDKCRSADGARAFRDLAFEWPAVIAARVSSRERGCHLFVAVSGLRESGLSGNEAMRLYSAAHTEVDAELERRGCYAGFPGIVRDSVSDATRFLYPSWDEELRLRPQIDIVPFAPVIPLSASARSSPDSSAPVPAPAKRRRFGRIPTPGVQGVTTEDLARVISLPGYGSHPTWVAMGYRLRACVGHGVSEEEARQCWIEWSSQWSGWKGPEECVALWPVLTPDRTGPGALLKLLRGATA